MESFRETAESVYSAAKQSHIVGMGRQFETKAAVVDSATNNDKKKGFYSSHIHKTCAVTCKVAYL